MLLGIVAILSLPASASARAAAHASAAGTGLTVTVAARECPTYGDIRANLARNNIMESLQDLGEDTLYTSGEPINPQLELQGQPKCKPITGWEFTLGSGIKEKASTGVWGALSIVTGAESPTVVTKASTPLLGWNNEPIPGVAIKGATTFELSRAQAERAAGNYLWIQGGTPTDPVLFEVPGFKGKYGFGALRCGIDNLNGDNVETIAFPAGTTHAFCYAYYVTPPPSSGTIVIRKEVEGSGTDPEDFHFGGNVSYNPGGTFDLSAAQGSPDEETFFRGETRAGEGPWTVNEEVPEGWTLSGLHCEADGSQVTTDRADAEVSIRLAAGDTVICTYVDQLVPPEGKLLLRKVTENGTGDFDFRVTDRQNRVAQIAHIETKEEETPAYAPPINLAPGTYDVSERSPHDRRGVWRPVSVACNGHRRPVDQVTVTVTAGEGALCTFTNRLDYKGRITIRKETLGGIGSAAFQITTPADPTLERNQTAVVKQERTPTLARGDSSHGLPFGTYVIQETAAQGTNAADWALVEVICDGKAVPFDQGRATVRVTERDPDVGCRFVNLFTASPGPGPTPTPPGPPAEPGEAAEITVTKTLVSSGTGPTPTDVFKVSVKNESAVTATDVVVTDEPGPGLAILGAEPSSGSCVHADQYLCSFPSIPPHGEATVLVEAKNYGGSTWNRAIVGSGSDDDEPAGNVDAARTEKPKRNYKACGSSVSVSARC